jgi:excinuclease UvrABC ATPase subunit
MAYLAKCSRCGSFYWLDPEAPVTGICPTCRAEGYEQQAVQQSEHADSDWCPDCNGFGSTEWVEDTSGGHWVSCKRCGGLGVVQQADPSVVYERLCQATRELRKAALGALNQLADGRTGESTATALWKRYVELSYQANVANEREIEYFYTHLTSDSELNGKDLEASDASGRLADGLDAPFCLVSALQRCKRR